MMRSSRRGRRYASDDTMISKSESKDSFDFFKAVFIVAGRPSEIADRLFGASHKVGAESAEGTAKINECAAAIHD
jgi:hypothetical protein